MNRSSHWDINHFLKLCWQSKNLKPDTNRVATKTTAQALSWKRVLLLSSLSAPRPSPKTPFRNPQNWNLVTTHLLLQTLVTVHTTSCLTRSLWRDVLLKPTPLTTLLSDTDVAFTFLNFRLPMNGTEFSHELQTKQDPWNTWNKVGKNQELNASFSLGRCVLTW